MAYFVILILSSSSILRHAVSYKGCVSPENAGYSGIAKTLNLSKALTHKRKADFSLRMMAENSSQTVWIIINKTAK